MGSWGFSSWRFELLQGEDKVGTAGPAPGGQERSRGTEGGPGGGPGPCLQGHQPWGTMTCEDVGSLQQEGRSPGLRGWAWWGGGLLAGETRPPSPDQRPWGSRLLPGRILCVWGKNVFPPKFTKSEPPEPTSVTFFENRVSAGVVRHKLGKGQAEGGAPSKATAAQGEPCDMEQRSPGFAGHLYTINNKQNLSEKKRKPQGCQRHRQPASRTTPPRASAPRPCPHRCWTQTSRPQGDPPAVSSCCCGGGSSGSQENNPLCVHTVPAPPCLSHPRNQPTVCPPCARSSLPLPSSFAQRPEPRLVVPLPEARVQGTLRAPDPALATLPGSHCELMGTSPSAMSLSQAPQGQPRSPLSLTS